MQPLSVAPAPTFALLLLCNRYDCTMIDCKGRGWHKRLAATRHQCMIKGIRYVSNSDKNCSGSPSILTYLVFMLHVHRSATPGSCNQSLERWFHAICTITHKKFVEPTNVTEIDGKNAMQTISLTSYVCTLTF